MYRKCDGEGGAAAVTLVPVFVLLKTGSVPVITRPSSWKGRG